MPEQEEIADLTPDALLELTSKIVTAYVSHNELPAAEVPKIIQSVHGALFALPKDVGGRKSHQQEPAVPILRSITPDYIVCLEDGKQLKMLKRYLRTHYDMTPAEYREKWGLPSDYPMVAPNYAAKRSEYAKQIGLGLTPDKRGKRGQKKIDV